MCSEAGVKFVYLTPYSLDLNPIEEFFAELNTFIRRIGRPIKVTLTKDLILSSNGVLMSSVRGGKA